MRTSGPACASLHLRSLVGICFKDLLEYREYSDGMVFEERGRGVMLFQGV